MGLPAVVPLAVRATGRLGCADRWERCPYTPRARHICSLVPYGYTATGNGAFWSCALKRPRQAGPPGLSGAVLDERRNHSSPYLPLTTLLNRADSSVAQLFLK